MRALKRSLRRVIILKGMISVFWGFCEVLFGVLCYVVVVRDFVVVAEWYEDAIVDFLYRLSDTLALFQSPVEG